MQYLIFTSNSNLLHNVLKNITDMIFSAFANSQIMCVSWLIFFPPYGSINWKAKITSRYMERQLYIVPKTLPQVRYK